MRKLAITSLLLAICLPLILIAMPVSAQGATTVYTKINSSFSVGNNYSYASSTIPSGSIIYYRENGITQFYGPDKKLLLSAKDSEASQVPTPEGLMPASRVQEVPDGAFIDPQGNVTKVYSNPDKKNCILTIIDQTNSSDTQPLIQNSNLQATATNQYWVESAVCYPAFSSLRAFNAYWKVPTAPKNKGGVVDMIFTGIEPDSQTIIQPVLAWNWGGSGRWQISSWYVYPSGNPINPYYSIKSYPLNVNVGDTLFGSMVYLPTGNCWQVAIFTNNMANVSRQISINGSHVFSGTQNLWTYCALEGYNIASNNDICGKIEFFNMVCANSASNNLNIPWRVNNINSTAAPLTNLSVKIVSSSDVILYTANK